MGLQTQWWVAAAVVAGAAGAGIALWRAPHTVDVPLNGHQSAPPAGAASGPLRPEPAPPSLALASPLPPGVSAERWARLQRELAAQPAELERLAGYYRFADAVQRLRGPDAAMRREAAVQVDSSLDERLRQRELSAGEARLLKIAALEVLLPDASTRQAELARWEAAQAAALPVDTATREREADFQRRQAALVAAWRAQPPAMQDARALERDLEALRRNVFDNHATQPPGGPR